ncbi:MarR family protein [Pedococcus dokdonensis]|uniref:MarR family protein n=1 Tax=Pedococcus dokdonensis TaxID=443156 RepID=A0A1H0RN57_9MICO|nr:MarR family transcriptional regulator [Pedococcus dokdonensis]SDP30942.1 MarR family protein [Pedococcus dokdonensis]
MTPTPAAADPARFVERFGSALTAAGMQRLPARVFAALLADEDGRMTAAEIGEVLTVSPASVSGAVRSLEQLRMIHREREPGTRRDVHVVADDAWHDVMINSATIYTPLTETLRDGVDQVGGAGTQAGDRLALSVAFLEFVTEEMQQLSDRWDKRRAELGH